MNKAGSATTAETGFAAENVGRHVLAYLQKIKMTPLAKLDDFDEEGNATVGQVINIWIRLSLILTRRRPEIAVSSLMKHVLPVIGEVPLNKMTRLRLNRLFNVLLAEGKISEAKRVFALCKQFFGWAETQGYLTHSPLSSMKRRDVGGRNTPPRERALTDAEIWIFWHGLDLWDISEQCRWALRLCLLTARRPDEVVCARKEEFHLRIGLWRQGTRNKSARDHSLPLTPLMITCINALISASPGESPWLVPSPLDAQKPLSRGAVTQVIRRMLRAERGLGIDAFTTRDLRRTARSKLSSLNVPNDVARKIMNHSLEGIDRVYDTHDYLPQMKQALDAFSDNIQGIIDAPDYLDLRHQFEGESLQVHDNSLLYMER
ncbi:tyrosine-type recombinase/integrase [Rahnella victoriana]|uniref:tyrosine-type recombinase/integrase n=1 Tax=Rahnella victoriana TaxID=1510570 RepID=UPI001E42EB95|nr:site-specific integrase [Rahnella victoriana]UHM93415.1 site-specific integrase [Rahnella victoriana]